MKAASIKTILNVSCVLAFSAALAPVSQADVWTVNPNGSVSSTRGTTANAPSANASGDRANNSEYTATAQAEANAAAARRTQTRDSASTDRRGSQRNSSEAGARHWRGRPYPAPGYGYGVPGYGYYPPAYPVYEPPYGGPVAPEPFGWPAWVSSFPTGGASYYYPYPNYNYYPPQVIYPPVVYYPGYPYYPWGTVTLGTSAISSSNTVTGGVSVGIGSYGLQPSMTGVMQPSPTGVMQPMPNGIQR